MMRLSDVSLPVRDAVSERYGPLPGARRWLFAGSLRMLGSGVDIDDDDQRRNKVEDSWVGGCGFRLSVTTDLFACTRPRLECVCVCVCVVYVWREVRLCGGEAKRVRGKEGQRGAEVLWGTVG